MSSRVTTFQTANIYIGFVLILSGVIPTGLALSGIFGGMYGPTFKHFSPAIYHLANLSISYLVTTIVVYFILNRMDFFARLNIRYASTVLFAVGNGIIIVYLAVRIFSSTIPGGGAPLAVSMIGLYPIYIAKTLLYIAIARVLIGVTPRE